MIEANNLDDEVWKDIPDWEGFYQISNKGNVKALNRIVNSKRNIPRKLKEKLLSLVFRGDYNVVCFYKGSIRINKFVHRLVAQVFVPNPENKPQVNHIDGDKLNNNDWNLEWVTSRENACHKYATHPSSSQKTGVRYRKDHKKWISQIRVKGKLLHLGTFNSEDEAYKARVDYEKTNNINNKYL